MELRNITHKSKQSYDHFLFYVFVSMCFDVFFSNISIVTIKTSRNYDLSFIFLTGRKKRVELK